MTSIDLFEETLSNYAMSEGEDIRRRYDNDIVSFKEIIPNFDNCRQYLDNDFPYQHYVLVCTSDARDTLKFENRKTR